MSFIFTALSNNLRRPWQSKYFGIISMINVRYAVNVALAE